MYSAQNLTPEQVTEAYQRMATRSAEDSGKPRVVPQANMTIPQLQAELVKAGYTITAQESEIGGLRVQLEGAKKEVADLSARLQAASGVTTASREHETLLKIQRADVTQRNTIWNLEATLSAQRRSIESLQNEVKSLRKACAPTRQRDIEEATVFEADLKPPPRLRQPGDVMPESAA